MVCAGLQTREGAVVDSVVRSLNFPPNGRAGRIGSIPGSQGQRVFLWRKTSTVADINRVGSSHCRYVALSRRPGVRSKVDPRSLDGMLCLGPGVLNLGDSSTGRPKGRSGRRSFWTGCGHGRGGVGVTIARAYGHSIAFRLTCASRFLDVLGRFRSRSPQMCDRYV